MSLGRNTWASFGMKVTSGNDPSALAFISLDIAAFEVVLPL